MLIPIILAVACVGVFLARKHMPGALSKGLLGLIMVGAVASSLLHLRSPTGVASDRVFDVARGHQAGQWIQEHVKNPGRVLFLSAETGSVAERTVLDAELDGLEHALDSSEWQVERRSLTVEEAAESLGGQFIPDARLGAMQRESGPYVAIVLSGGLPVATGTGKLALPPVLCLNDPDPSTRSQSLRNGLLAAVVVPRPQADLTVVPASNTPPDEVFALRHELLQVRRAR